MSHVISDVILFPQWHAKHNKLLSFLDGFGNRNKGERKLSYKVQVDLEILVVM